MKYILSLLCSIGCMMSWVVAINQPAIITRDQRGADESLRLGNGGPAADLNNLSDERRAAIQRRQTADRYLVDNFPHEFKVDSTITDRNGKSILRDISLNKDKFKLIIHHTARAPVSNSYADVVAELLDIYKFHTINRRRGDIGYNYVIGPSGEIFEGRAGGPSAVGAHTVNNNGGSIGISLMGNFDLTEPTPAQLDATIQLAARLAKQYNIDVYRQVTHHEASLEDPYIISFNDDSLIGHKDAGDTACPGKYLYQKLSIIKSQVSGIVGGTIPQDLTPSAIDPVRYYIPNKMYQLNVPRNLTDTITSCVVDGQTWNISKCSINDNILSLSLIKLNEQSHQGVHRVILTQDTNKYYLYLNLEYNNIAIMSGAVVGIPNKSDFNTGSMVGVLLYDLSTSQNLRTVICTKGCRIELNDQSSITLKNNTAFQVSVSGYGSDSTLYFWRGNKRVALDQIRVSAIGSSSVRISNYGRSHNAVRLNERRGSLTRSQQQFKPIGAERTTGFTITNRVRFDDYMRGLVIGQRDLPQSYHDVMYLSAATNARYRTALTDDARIHQYYGGQNARSLNHKRQLSNDLMNKKLLKINTNLTYAPVFECSNGRTRNGIIDIGICPNKEQSGNGIGISRLGAVKLSQRGYSASQIIDYYLPGISIAQLP